VVGFPSALAPLVWGPRAKSRTLDDYLTSDLPVTSLRVNSFTDKTIVALEWHHTVFDAIGMQYVFEGWQSMLWGRDDEIPTPFDKDSDPFATLGQGTWSAGQKHVLADRQLRMASLLRWVLRYFVDNYARKSEIRMVCIPEASWRGWLDKALEELRAEAVAKGADPSSVFLTENDIVSAWLLKHTVEYMDPNWMVRTESGLPRLGMHLLMIDRSKQLLSCLFVRPSKGMYSPVPQTRKSSMATPSASAMLSHEQATWRPSR